MRAQGIGDVAAIHTGVALPLIGLWKIAIGGVFIPPTLQHALAAGAAGADIVAIDGTRREPSLEQTIRALHEEIGALVMADAGSIDDGIASEDAGADLVGITLAGYTGLLLWTDGPDFDVLSGLAHRLGAPLFAEGRMRTPAHATTAMDAGAFAVVVGTAITHPATITSWFAAALSGVSQH